MLFLFLFLIVQIRFTVSLNAERNCDVKIISARVNAFLQSCLSCAAPYNIFYESQNPTTGLIQGCVCAGVCVLEINHTFACIQNLTKFLCRKPLKLPVFTSFTHTQLGALSSRSRFSDLFVHARMLII